MHQRYSVVKTVIVPNNISLNNFILITKDYLATQMIPKNKQYFIYVLVPLSTTHAPCGIKEEQDNGLWRLYKLAVIRGGACACVCRQIYRNVNIVYERRRWEDGDGSLAVTEQSFKWYSICSSRERNQQVLFKNKREKNPGWYWLKIVSGKEETGGWVQSISVAEWVRIGERAFWIRILPTQPPHTWPVGPWGCSVEEALGLTTAALSLGSVMFSYMDVCLDN